MFRISKHRPSPTRRDYHRHCTVLLHRAYGKQQQTCKGCIYDVAKRCYIGCLSVHQTYKQVGAVARCYWCPFCLARSVEAGSFAAPTPLQNFGYPGPQGPYYCSVGFDVAFGRQARG